MSRLGQQKIISSVLKPACPTPSNKGSFQKDNFFNKFNKTQFPIFIAFLAEQIKKQVVLSMGLHDNWKCGTHAGVFSHTLAHGSGNNERNRGRR